MIESMNAEQRKATIENWAYLDPVVAAVLNLAHRDRLTWEHTLELLVLHLAAAKSELTTVAIQTLARARPESVALPIAPPLNAMSA